MLDITPGEVSLQDEDTSKTTYRPVIVKPQPLVGESHFMI